MIKFHFLKNFVFIYIVYDKSSEIYMNILFGNYDTEIKSLFPETPDENQNYVLNNDKQFFHILEFSLNNIYKQTRRIIDKKLIHLMSHYKCSSILCNTTNTNNTIILQFNNLPNTINFAHEIRNFAIPSTIRSISKTRESELFQKQNHHDEDLLSDVDSHEVQSDNGESNEIESSDSTLSDSTNSEPVSPNLSDKDTVLNKILLEPNNQSNKLIFRLITNNNYINPYIPLEYDTKLKTIVQDSIKLFDQENYIIKDQDLEIRSFYFNQIIKYTQQCKSIKNKIIKAQIPKMPFYSTIDKIMMRLSCMYVPSYSGDPEPDPEPDQEPDHDSDLDSGPDEKEFDISVLDHTWDYTTYQYETLKVLNWIDHKPKTNKLVLSIDSVPILYFNNETRAEKYLKHLAMMIIRKAHVHQFPYTFKLENTSRGYKISKCILNIIFPIYIEFCNITLTPIFEIE